MNSTAIIQARMGSSRLPGKVMMDFNGEPMLARVIRLASEAKKIEQVVVATTVLDEDNRIAEWCEENSTRCFRGSVHDVLDRFYHAAKRLGVASLVRLTADCPLLDPVVIDRSIDEFNRLQPNCDYLATKGYPRGLDTEVFRFDALERTWLEDSDPAWREHVTVYMYNNSDSFHVHYLSPEVDHAEDRWTVDTNEDFQFAQRVAKERADESTDWRATLKLIDKHPEWKNLNRNVQQKAVPKDTTDA
jgi:spore coat polysaccharide biosynthesis protein SpsF